MKKAFNQISKLSELEQNIFAKWLLEELTSEKRWERRFAESEDILDKLADEAVEEYFRGKTKPLDIDEL